MLAKKQDDVVVDDDENENEMEILVPSTPDKGIAYNTKMRRSVRVWVLPSLCETQMNQHEMSRM